MQIQNVCCFLCFLFVLVCGQNTGNGMILNEDIATSNKAEIIAVEVSEQAVLPCYNNITGVEVVWLGPNSKLLAIDDKLAQRGKRIGIDRQSQNHWNLQINDVELDDQGIYECRINSQPVIVKPVILVVQVRPLIQRVYSHYITAIEGDNVELECVSDGIPPPSITWYRVQNDNEQTREKIEIDGEGIYIDEDERCIIANMSMRKAGIYDCHASNGVGEGDRKRFYIQYKLMPTFSVPEGETVTFEERGTAVLPCAVQNLGEYEVVWAKSRSRITSNRRIFWSDRFSFKQSSSLEDWTLQIDPVFSADQGNYSCQLTRTSQEPIQKTVVLKVT